MESITVGTSIFKAEETTLFSDTKGQIKDSIRKNRLIILEKLALILPKIISKDEIIYIVCNAVAPMPFFEQFSMGWYIYKIKKSVLIFTDKKIIHVYVDQKGQSKDMIRYINYSDLEKYTAAGGAFSGRSLTIIYKNKKKETFTGLKEDSRKIQILLDNYALKAAALPPTKYMGAYHVCPNCALPLEDNVYKCAGCQQLFKDNKTMIKWSIFMPGGGYLYTGHLFLFFFDFLAEALLLYLFIISLLGMDWSSTLIFGIFLFAEKVFTIHHCQIMIKSYIPIKS